jgi:hypothetical protein
MATECRLHAALNVIFDRDQCVRRFLPRIYEGRRVIAVRGDYAKTRMPIAFAGGRWVFARTFLRSALLVVFPVSQKSPQL